MSFMDGPYNTEPEKFVQDIYYGLSCQNRGAMQPMKKAESICSQSKNVKNCANSMVLTRKAITSQWNIDRELYFFTQTTILIKPDRYVIYYYLIVCGSVGDVVPVLVN